MRARAPRAKSPNAGFSDPAPLAPTFWGGVAVVPAAVAVLLPAAGGEPPAAGVLAPAAGVLAAGGLPPATGVVVAGPAGMVLVSVQGQLVMVTEPAEETMRVLPLLTIVVGPGKYVTYELTTTVVTELVLLL